MDIYEVLLSGVTEHTKMSIEKCNKQVQKLDITGLSEVKLMFQGAVRDYRLSEEKLQTALEGKQLEVKTSTSAGSQWKNVLKHTFNCKNK